MNRLAKPVAVATGFILLCAASGMARVQSATPSPMQTPKVASQESQAKKDAAPADDFAGLNYTDEQKAEIEKIHQTTRTNKEAVAKDSKLTPEQKDAMLTGYTRMEYGQIYRVLSTEQKREVQRRIRARRAADHAERIKKAPNQGSTMPTK